MIGTMDIGYSIAETSLKKALDRYSARRKRSKIFLKTAKQISAEEITEATQNALANPNPKNLAILLRSLTHSSTWLANSYGRYLIGHLDFERVRFKELNSPRVKYILQQIKTNCKIDIPKLSNQEIFQTILLERQFAHQHPSHTGFLNAPTLKATVVLVDGVLNEVFSISSFERALRSLKKLSNINYFIPDIHGTKGCHFNANSLRMQLEAYINDHPNEKLWLLGYSKGGLDTLHYLRENTEFAKAHILGISTVASPIIGSEKFNHKLIKLVRSVQQLADTTVYKKVSKNRDLLLKDLMRFLNIENQHPWFVSNSAKLPQELFYTATALKSEWYESALPMILTKLLFQSDEPNDGIVACSTAQFPDYFSGINLGTVRGHHLVGSRSSYYSQEALIEAHIIFLKYLKVLK